MLLSYYTQSYLFYCIPISNGNFKFCLIALITIYIHISDWRPLAFMLTEDQIEYNNSIIYISDDSLMLTIAKVYLNMSYQYASHMP